MCLDRLGSAQEGLVAGHGDGLLALRFNVRWLMFLRRVSGRLKGGFIAVLVINPAGRLNNDVVRLLRYEDHGANANDGCLTARVVLSSL